MKLWNFIKDKMMKPPSQIVCEGDAKMTYEELVIFSEMFAEKLKGEKCCAILCNSEMAAAMGLLSQYHPKTALKIMKKELEYHGYSE